MRRQPLLASRKRRRRPGSAESNPGVSALPTDRAADGTRWIFFFYLALLVWAPLPLGSNRPWSGAVLNLGILLLAMAWLVSWLRGRVSCGEILRESRLVLACLVSFAGYAWLQLLPLPMELLGWLSPHSALWHAAARLPGDAAFAPLTLDRYGTLEAACRATAHAAFFVLSLLLLRERDRLRTATYVLIFSGVLQALYGAFVSLQTPSGVAHGTFVNRNHYAGYLEMCVSIGIGVLIGSLSGERSRSWGQFFMGLLRWVITPRMGLRLLLVAMVIALVLSRSRMGNTAFFASLLIAGTLGLLLSRRAARSTVVLLASLVLIDLAIVGTYFGAQRVVENIGHTSMQTEDRDELAGYALRMWKDFPVFGSGLGSFAAVFPRYSGSGTALSYTHAHNDYLEIAAETGLIGIGLFGTAVLASLYAALRAQATRRDEVMRGIAFGATMGIVSLMIHCSVEFNLQIPANALTFVLLLAFAWLSRHHEEPSADTR